MLLFEFLHIARLELSRSRPQKKCSIVKALELSGTNQESREKRFNAHPWRRKQKLKGIKEHSERGHPEFEVSERVVLQGVRKIVDTIEVHKIPWGLSP